MIISEKHKYIFIRYPKTGSSSLIVGLGLDKKDLYNGLDQKQFLDFVHSKTNINYCPHHIPMYELNNLYPEVYKNKSRYFKFCFVRNPYERLVSAWSYGFNSTPRFNVGSVSFKKFIKKHLDVWQPIPINVVDFARGCDFIFKYESLQKSFKKIAFSLNIRIIELPHVNETNHQHYTEYYDDETKQIVAEKYAKDIQYFGYEFDKKANIFLKK